MVIQRPLFPFVILDGCPEKVVIESWIDHCTGETIGLNVVPLNNQDKAAGGPLPPAKK